MRIIVPVSSFRDIVSSIAPLAKRNGVLGLSALGGRVIVTAIGVEVSAEAIIPCDVQENGSTFLPAATTPTALSTMPTGGSLTISSTDNRVQLRCGGDVRIDWQIPSGDMGAITQPDRDAVELDGGGLALCIQRVESYAKKAADASQALECIHFSTSDGYLFAVSVGRGKACMAIAGTPARGELTAALITRDASMALRRMLDCGPCKIWADENRLVVKCGPYLVEVMQVNGSFPPWRNAIPSKEEKVDVSPEDFVAALRQVDLIPDESGGVRLILDQDHVTLSRGGSLGNVEREIPIAQQERTASCRIKHEFLMPALANCPKGKVAKLHVPEEGGACHVEFEGARYYIATMV